MSATTSSSLESSFQCEEEEGGDTQSTDNNNCCLDNLVAVGDEAVAVDDHLGQHPSLQSMCVIDCDNDTRIVPNGPPAILSNECFEGKVMLLVRTPDVDDDDADCDGDFDKNSMTLEARRVSQSFKGKKRRFEFQFQVRLKRVPTGPLFLGCELEQAVRVGTITKGLVNILLAMVRRINPGFHYSWGPPPGGLEASSSSSLPTVDSTGDYEKTHLSFPVEASMDRIVITKPGDTPPVLGYELHESTESVKRRRKMGAGSVDWNLQDTYTMCLWSAYCDWIKWKSLNVPGMSPFSLTRVTGKQPIYLSVYEIDNISPADYRKRRPAHLRKHLHVYTRLEFSHAEKTVGGRADRVGRRRRNTLFSEQSLPDTESLDDDFETASRVSHITIS
jgi:hypothetical protein